MRERCQNCLVDIQPAEYLPGMIKFLDLAMTKTDSIAHAQKYTLLRRHSHKPC